MSDVRLWCVVEPERRIKTTRIMASLAPGWGEKAALVAGMPPNDGAPFAIWGQLWTALDAIPQAIRADRPFWHIDNGYWRPAKGGPFGYYRFTYRGMTPVMFDKPDYERAEAMCIREIKPWRTTGKHVLIALPSVHYGRAMGIKVIPWACKIQGLVRQHTDRPIIIRTKEETRPLREQLRGCWALVTHSSNAAVEAAKEGVPVFVEPTSAAAPVGNLDLADLEKPEMPGNRRQWWASLVQQQFTLAEMNMGLAFKYLRVVREMVDGK